MNRLRLYLTLGLGTVGSIIGIASGANSLLGGGGGAPGTGGGASSTYQPGGQPQADQGWQGLLQQFLGGQGGESGAIQPQIAQAFQQLLGIPTSGVSQAGQQAGQQYGGLSQLAQQYQQQMQGQAGVNQGAQQNLMNAGNQLWQTAQDPQQQLQQQLQQQVTDSSRANASAAGLGTSAQGVGTENQAMQNFLLNWQNQQLGRQATGLQGMAGAYQGAGQQGQQAGQNLAGSMAFGAMQPQYTLQQGNVPFQQAQMAAGAPFGYANQYSGAEGALLQQMMGGMGAIDPYLGLGQSASQAGFGQQQTGLNNLTTGLGQFGNQMNNPGSWLSQLFSGGGQQASQQPGDVFGGNWGPV
jgi:hypothetical protein